MKSRKVAAVSNQLKTLIKDIRNLSDKPVGEHLSDDDFIGYAMDSLKHESIQRVNQHLASCPKCAANMEHLLEESKDWSGKYLNMKVIALRERLFKKLPEPNPLIFEGIPKTLFAALSEAARDWEQTLQAMPLAAASLPNEDQKFWNWRSKNGVLAGHAIKERNGDLTFRFDSKHLELAGKHFTLQIGSFSRKVILERVSKKEAGATVIIQRSDRPANIKKISFKMD